MIKSSCLTDEEREALLRHLRDVIAGDRYPMAPRLAPLGAILDKLDPPKPRAPLSEPKPRMVPPRATVRQRRR
jgi:hypothetical protein